MSELILRNDHYSRLKEKLRMHFNFLIKSAAAFDDGETDESMRMAVSMRVLLHDTRSSISLLTQLNAKDIFLTSTCGQIPTGAVMNSGSMFFYHIKMTPHGLRTMVKPCLNDGPPIPPYHLKAEEWWSQIVFVLSHGTDRRISRKDIVLVAANKDGGAHVDQSLTPQYESLQKLGGTRTFFQMNIDGEEKTFKFENIHQVLIRQMTYELLNSPALLALAVP